MAKTRYKTIQKKGLLFGHQCSISIFGDLEVTKHHMPICHEHCPSGIPEWLMLMEGVTESERLWDAL